MPHPDPTAARWTLGRAAHAAATTLTAVLLLLPMVAVLLSSLGETAYATFPPRGLTLRWYAALNEVPDLIPSLTYSLKLAGLVTVGSVGLALLAGVGLTVKAVPGKALVTTFLISPLVLPSIVVGLALLLFFNTIWLADHFTALLVGHLVISLPYALRSILPALETFDRSLWSASRTLGASPLRAFATIMVPIAWPGIASASIFAFLVSFDNYNISVFLQDPVNPTLPVILYNQAEQALSPVLMAISTLLILFSVVLVAGFSRYLVHGQALSSHQ